MQGYYVKLYKLAVELANFNSYIPKKVFEKGFEFFLIGKNGNQWVQFEKKNISKSKFSLSY